MRGKKISDQTSELIARAALQYPQRVVALLYEVSPASVSRIVKRFRQHPQPLSPRRQGRPPKVTPRFMHLVSRSLRKYRRSSLKEICGILQKSNLFISVDTLRRAMQKLGFKRRVARVKPILNKATKLKRRLYAAKHRQDSTDAWDSTICTDEASVKLSGTTITWITRQVGEAMSQDCMVPKLKSGKGSLMVWGGIWVGGRTDLVRFDTSESEGKRLGVTAKIFREQVMKGELRKVWKRQMIWAEIPQDMIDRTIKNMPARLAAVKRANGGPTKY
ncbi:hypothetical protein IAU59_007595 [Kwoniella sp. CBS 9459]